VCVCPISTCEPLHRCLWNFVGMWYHSRGPWHGNFNPAASTIPKWQMYKHLRWMQNCHQSTYKTTFARNQKYECGRRMNFEIHAFLMEAVYEPLHLHKRSWVKLRTMDIPASFIWIIISLTELLNMEMMGFSNMWGGCKNFTSQRATMKRVLMNFQRMDNFYEGHFATNEEY
jgi:hypothetical protein